MMSSWTPFAELARPRREREPLTGAKQQQNGGDKTMREYPHSAAPFALLGRVRARFLICGKTSLAKSVMLRTVRA